MSETVRIDIPDYKLIDWMPVNSWYFEEWHHSTSVDRISAFARSLGGRSLVWDAKSRRVVMKHFSNTSDFLRRK